MIGLGLGYDADLTVRDMIPWVQEAERRGFDLVFFSETIMTLRDAITALTAFALSTQRVNLGCTQIVRLRTPLVLAQTFASLDEISGNRMLVSLGACTESHARKNGLEHQNPAETLREYIQAVKLLLKGDTVNYSGKYIKLIDSKLSFKPPRPNLPIYVAATSKTGLQIAGELADGVLLNATTSAEYCRNALRIVRESAEKAGRNPDEIKVAGIVVSAVSNDREEALNQVRKEVASKFDPLQVDFAVRPRMRVGEPYVSEEIIQKLLKSHAEGGFEKLMRDIPEDVLRGLTAVGTAEEVRQRIEEYRKAGVTLPIVRPATRKVMKSTMEAVAPQK
ncbi:MAG: LLM class flavin-dependent oxidoreductase [Candidatus Caldarchaeum sp.]|jgi:alkanesulfonate monooxygenase SsuD/methylene tetrahydromethanopterin reductase-like flavin-dependent oxidoreductase (luciferase family)